MKELATEYRQSAQLLRKRLHDLRAELQLAQTPDVRWRLKQRINDLAPMLTQTNKIARLLEHYYERGHYRDAEYSANAFGAYHPATIRKRPEDIPQRTDTGPEGYSGCLPDQGRITERVRKKARCKQIDSEPQFAPSDEEIAALHSVLISSGPAVLEQLFPQIEKEIDKNEK